MTRLRNSDLQAVVEFLGEASSIDGPDPFPRPLLESLRRLVPSDEVAYDELDRVRETVLWEEIFPGERPMGRTSRPTGTSGTSILFAATTR